MGLLKRKKQTNIPRRRLSQIESKADKSRNLTPGNFRRSSTLVRSVSKNESGKTESDTVFESSRSKLHHLTMKRRKVFGAMATTLLVAVFIWTIISNFTAIPIVSSSEGFVSKSIKSDKYEKIIQDYLSANPMSRFNFVINLADLTNYVTLSAPEVLSVTQSGMGDLPGKTNFNIAMRQPVATWSVGDKQYYVDSSGVAFEESYYSDPEVQVVDESGVNIKSNTTVASNKMLSFVGLIVSASKGYGYTVTKVVLPADTTRELDLRLANCDYYIKVSVDRPVGEQIEDMARSIKYLSEKGRGASYIDVRVSGKAFYK